MTTTRRTALLSGLAAITGAFVSRLFRRGLPAPMTFAVDQGGADRMAVAMMGYGAGGWAVAEATEVPLVGTWMSATAAARIREGQLVALRPDGTVGPA